MTDQLALENWSYYEYAVNRGHIEYCEQAKRCEDFYLGGGLQWSPEDVETLEAENRPVTEINEIMPAINSITGYQINNRMDISFFPRGEGADQQKAEVMSKVFRQIYDDVGYKWKETNLFDDGLIQQRGYLDIRVKFNDNMSGEADVDILDPLDVIPDPDAKSYSPEGWGYCIINRWYTNDTINELFGKEKAQAVEDTNDSSGDWGDQDQAVERNKFGDRNSSGQNGDITIDGIRRFRVIERQYYVYEMTDVAISPCGDVRVIADNQEDVPSLVAQGWLTTKRMQRRVKWAITTQFVTLFDGYSPLSRISIVPYFPYFRRGRTRGLIDNAISPQEAFNKGISQFLHIINTTANSGYMVEENSLTNMTTEELKEKGAETGVVIEYKQGTSKPEKIQANQVPVGLDKFVERMHAGLKSVTGDSGALRADFNPGDSGVAIQSRQFIAQQQHAIPLDNLARTRHLAAELILEIVQKFCTDEQIVRTTDKDAAGNDVHTNIPVNQVQPDGTILNDLSIGKYDLVIADQPMAVTWENSQFQQCLDMRKQNINLPDDVMIKHSNLTDKSDIIKRMQDAKSDPTAEANAKLIEAKTKDTIASAVNKMVEAQFSATTAANLIAGTPSLAPLADALLLSAGFEDQNAAPIVPQPTVPAGPQDLLPPMHENTHPIMPPNPDAGANAGMEATPQ